MKRIAFLKEKIFPSLLKAAGLPLCKPFVIFFFKYMNQFMPYKRLLDGIHWEAIYHPKPIYPLHILILPKTSVTSLDQVPNDSSDFYSDLFTLVKKLITMFDLEERGYRLLTNGGPNQSLPQWHWHLISENNRHG